VRRTDDELAQRAVVLGCELGEDVVDEQRHPFHGEAARQFSEERGEAHEQIFVLGVRDLDEFVVDDPQVTGELFETLTFLGACFGLATSERVVVEQLIDSSELYSEDGPAELLFNVGVAAVEILVADELGGERCQAGADQQQGRSVERVHREDHVEGEQERRTGGRAEHEVLAIVPAPRSSRGFRGRSGCCLRSPRAGRSASAPER